VLGDIAVEVAERPFNGGHVVIKLKKPVFELGEGELVALKNVIDSIIKHIKAEFSPEGFNIYIKDREVHVIPRWCGDINVAFFGGIKVIPLAPSDVYKRVIEKCCHESNA
jgi:ATP adenylyltransferase